jgi:hypothetical protein
VDAGPGRCAQCSCVGLTVPSVVHCALDLSVTVLDLAGAHGATAFGLLCAVCLSSTMMEQPPAITYRQQKSKTQSTFAAPTFCLAAMSCCCCSVLAQQRSCA